jgi:hypothetical protein
MTKTLRHAHLNDERKRPVVELLTGGRAVTERSPP